MIDVVFIIAGGLLFSHIAFSKQTDDEKIALLFIAWGLLVYPVFGYFYN